MTTIAQPEKKDVPAPKRDETTGGLTRPLDYAETLEAFTVKDSEKFTPRLGRFYASNIGRCVRQTYYKVTNTPPDEEAKGFDEGVGERGNAVEDRITLMLRSVHGEDVVLQNVRITKRMTIPHPKTGEPTEIVIVCKTDPAIVGDNLDVLKLYEVKTKGWFSKALEHWPNEEGMWKVPLFMAKVDEEKTLGVAGAAAVHNAMQLAIEAHILTELGRAPKQVVLLYVDPGNLRRHLEIVFGPSDVKALGELAERQIVEVMTYVLKGEVPPPLYAMPWECQKTYCDWQVQCAALNKERKEDRQLHPMFGSVNAMLEKARKGAKA